MPIKVLTHNKEFIQYYFGDRMGKIKMTQSEFDLLSSMGKIVTIIKTIPNWLKNFGNEQRIIDIYITDSKKN